MLLTVPATAASCIAAVVGLGFGVGMLAVGLSPGAGLRALSSGRVGVNGHSDG